MNRQILRIAIPSILTNIAVPLLGMADAAIAGHMGSAVFIAAIALGSTFVSMAYWGFGFLRMSTGGLTAQACGEGDMDKCSFLLRRSIVWALMIAGLLLLVHRPLLAVALYFAEATEAVKLAATTYFNIVILGAPAVLTTSCMSGWFIGMQHAKEPLYIALLQNVLNIILSALLVFGCGWKMEGVALGTLVSQYVGMAFALWYAVKLGGLRFERKIFRLRTSELFDTSFAAANRDIFLRSFCLLAVTTFFTFAGSRQGEVVLAANALLMQFFLLFSYVMDGFAYAAEALCGKAYGARKLDEYARTVRMLMLWGVLLAAIFALLYAVAGGVLIRLLTDVSSVAEAAVRYLPYMAVVPVVSFVAFLCDGIFIGTSQTRQMLQTMLVAMSAFFVAYYLAPLGWGNHALWGAFLAYLFVRSVVAYWLSSRVGAK